MPSRDAFALHNAGLDSFLFAEIGIEPNGWPLTILSMLARQGEDPWAQAAAWAKLPRPASTDALARCIGEAALRAPGVAQARATAERLVLLLPKGEAGPASVTGISGTKGADEPRWLVILLMYCAVALGIALTNMVAPPSQPAVAAHVAPIDAPAGNSAHHP